MNADLEKTAVVRYNYTPTCEPTPLPAPLAVPHPRCVRCLSPLRDGESRVCRPCLERAAAPPAEAGRTDDAPMWLLWVIFAPAIVAVLTLCACRAYGVM